jgi:hypothetical protein
MPKMYKVCYIVKFGEEADQSDDEIVQVSLYRYFPPNLVLIGTQIIRGNHPFVQVEKEWFSEPHPGFALRTYDFFELKAAMALYENLIKTTDEWLATHVLISSTGVVSVRRANQQGDGPAYTSGEWLYEEPELYRAEFEVVDGKWLFQGQPFSGKVLDV